MIDLDIPNVVKSLFRRVANRVGLDVQRYRPSRSARAQLGAMLAKHNVDVVIDVGANEGQFGCLLREIGYEGDIVSFEPSEEAHANLSRIASRDRRWTVAPRCALGASVGTSKLNVSANSVSSSLLGMLEQHRRAAPDSIYVATESVPVDTLDRLAPHFATLGGAVFLKVDTQGYEGEVLAGATATLGRCVGLQLEMSLVALYEGQMLFDELYRKLTSSGFCLWGISPVFIDPDTGRLLQFDATFFRQQ